ncbi:MAG: hypothetical protein LBU79_07480 [Planctomycetota bacterium]|jgi:hypothetical protein|nr:hypothetical protein [Planctomycetota bacterium]
MLTELEARRLLGKIVRANDTGVDIELKGKMGLVRLPHRSLITDKHPEVGDPVEICLSYARIVAPAKDQENPCQPD